MATKLTAHNRSTGSNSKPGSPGGPEPCDLSGDDLLELFGDKYTRRVLEAVIDEPKSGTEIVEEASVSKATVYRRLETLREAGLVTASTVLDPDGHHHEQFLAVVEAVSLDFDGTALSADVRYK